MALHGSIWRRTGVALSMLPILLVGCGGSSGTAGRPSADGNDSLDIESGSLLSDAVRQDPLSPIEIPLTNLFGDARLTEASGMQRSQIVDGVYYAHNDSGSDPVLYVSDARGRNLGLITVSNAASIDWEAIAGMRREGISLLIVADVGNNNRQRSDLEILIFEEPVLNGLQAGFEIAVAADRIGLSYADGLGYDAEAVFVDGDNDTLVVLTKDGLDTSAQSIWKGSISTALTDGNVVLQYSGLVGLESQSFVNAITDVDIHPDGREIAVLTYGSVPAGRGRIHLWEAQEGEGTTDALIRAADKIIDVPASSGNVQAEGISYSPDGNYLLISAEGSSVSTVTVIAR